ncbi:VanZ family protein [Paenarthrobacter nicotinovorans]|uniref:VanZ family protein n=1 Tax=Paenarthrobacter nicotinovorans TaxID=29320 RepID=UPI00248696FB|nr:VanZ family protein [Paenarthrobacter nicotinovorans]
MKKALPWRLALIAYLVGLGLVGFWPNKVDMPIQGTLASMFGFLHRNGIPIWVDYDLLEASANLAMFIPLGALAAWAFPKQAWWRISAVASFMSVCMEVGQLVFLSTRIASMLDVAMNTLGAVIGVAVARYFVLIPARSTGPATEQ